MNGPAEIPIGRIPISVLGRASETTHSHSCSEAGIVNELKLTVIIIWLEADGGVGCHKFREGTVTFSRVVPFAST